MTTEDDKAHELEAAYLKGFVEGKEAGSRAAGEGREPRSEDEQNRLIRIVIAETRQDERERILRVAEERLLVLKQRLDGSKDSDAHQAYWGAKDMIEHLKLKLSEGE